MSATDGMRKGTGMDIFNLDSTSDVEIEAENHLTDMDGIPDKETKNSKFVEDPTVANAIPKEKVDRMAEMASEMAETVVRMADAVAKVREEDGIEKVGLLESKKKAQRRLSDEDLNEEDPGKVERMGKMAEEMAQMNRMMTEIAAKMEENDKVQRDEYPFRYIPDDSEDMEVFEENIDEPENNNLSNVDKMLLDVRKAFEDSLVEFQADNVTTQILDDSLTEQRMVDEEDSSEEFVSNTDLADSIAELAKVLKREEEARDNLSRFKDVSASKAVTNASKHINTPSNADELSVDAIERDASSVGPEELDENAILKKDGQTEEEGKEEYLVVENGIEYVVINHEVADPGEKESVSAWETSLEGTGAGMAGAAASSAWVLGHEAGAERCLERRRVVSLPSEAPETANPLDSPTLGRKSSITMPPPSETGNLVMTYVILLVLLIALWILYSGLV